jgi:hypothetical protein
MINYRIADGTRTTLLGTRHTAVNAYVRPGRTFTTVELDRQALGDATPSIRDALSKQSDQIVGPAQDWPLFCHRSED